MSASKLSDPSAEAEIAEGLAAGAYVVINRHSVSPGGLRFATAAELAWLDDGDGSEPDGCWLCGTGFVAIATEPPQVDEDAWEAS